MKNIYDTKMKLKLIKYSSFILLIISAAFITFNDTKLLGIIMVIVSLIFEWRLYRCPHCKISLDPRLNICENTYCPNCGENIVSNFK